MMNKEKSLALLGFLREAALLRKMRVPSYGMNDEILWLCDLPTGLQECQSPYLSPEVEDAVEWLEVRKRREPVRPPVPEIAADWVRADELNQAEYAPELLPEITLLVERQDADKESSPEHTNASVEKIPELCRLCDHPEVEIAWLEYLVNRWEPWSNEMKRWQSVQKVYEKVDLMRRRLEESEDRFELVFAVGLLQWRDGNSTLIKRHLLTAPAEIALDASRGVLSVAPAAAFAAFRVELDMLDYSDQPCLKGPELDERLEALDFQAWNQQKVGEILQLIANQANSNAHVDERTFTPLERTDEIFRVVFAPALVLRQRHPTAYEELVKGLRDYVTFESVQSLTDPWKRFISEGESPSSRGGAGPSEPEPAVSNTDENLGRLLFPLPTNAEQRKIVDCLRRNPYVMVKGPPGTGKSQTIANLICHLLASGDRILVTAHSAKALTVLRELLPESVRDLCVTALGSSRDDQRLLEEGVRQILRRQNEMSSDEWSEERLASLESELQQLEEQQSGIERKIRECREAEIHTHTLAGEYTGTAATIAKRIAEETENFGWMDAIPKVDASFPLKAEEVQFLAAVHGRLTMDWLQEVNQSCCASKLPDANEFVTIVEQCNTAAERASTLRHLARPEHLAALQSSAFASLSAAGKAIRILTEERARAHRVIGGITDEVLRDIVIRNESRWHRILDNIDRISRAAIAHSATLGTCRVELPEGKDGESLLADVERRHSHFKNGGRRWFCRLVKETRHVEERCRVEGSPPRSAEALNKVLASIQLKKCAEEFKRNWPSSIGTDLGDSTMGVATIRDHVDALGRLVALFDRINSEDFNCIPLGHRDSLAQPLERLAWLQAIDATLAGQEARAAMAPLNELSMVLRRETGNSDAHACVRDLESACENRDAELWRRALESRNRVLKQKTYLQKYDPLVRRLEAVCPGVEDMIRNAQGDPTWLSRLQQFEKAWYWAAARDWIHRVTDAAEHRSLVRASHRLQDAIEKKTEQIVSARSWRLFIGRLDDRTTQNLQAWSKTVTSLIRAGKGKFVNRHRRTARKYLTACTPKIPVWIMPLHRLWETIESRPGLFDTIIVDEASQAGIESLVLLLLAKRIIIVGDDKQNTPQAVGVREDDIARLARSHLLSFHFQELYRPDISLFDHAERGFGNVVSLKEHFRCVPEIIRFSNELCYSDTPLIPLRQAPPNRLPPLKAVSVMGSCEGDGMRIMNRSEAQSIVDTICKCVDSDEYDGKSMGVITLQGGQAQSDLIANMLAKVLDPVVIEERKLRCGTSETFQGDQRDVIFLSLVIAPNRRIRSRTGLPDQRRYNVAMSRARDQVWLFHSVQRHDLGPECLRRRLLAFFQAPTSDEGNQRALQWERLEAEARRSPRRIGDQPAPYESWFEVDVCVELLRRGYAVRPQYEFAGKFIDLVVDGVDARLAVECDGDFWHGAEQYDRDMSRQRQLERARWTFVRVRESEFYVDRPLAISHVTEECARLGIFPAACDVPGQDARAEGKAGDEEPPNKLAEGGALAGDESEKSDELEESQCATSGPFVGYSEACRFPDPREASSPNIRAALLTIIKNDGPLTRASVFKLYVEGCPHLQRGGKTVRQSLNRALGVMLRIGEIVEEDEIGDGVIENLVIRIAGTPRTRERPAGRRDLMDIPPSELQILLNRLGPPDSGEVDTASIFRRIMDHYGFTRLTASRKDYLAQVFQQRRSD